MYKDRIKKLESEIKEREDELAALKKKEMLFENSLTVVCPSCEGSGEESYTDAAGSKSYRTCLTCDGYGRIGPIECACGATISTDMSYTRRQTRSCPWCGCSIK